ncbi:MAG TPA: hypothetical protein VEA58_05845 [Anaerovoracaceae bacterium]|nr:hypothetical protein [Anaerovoracaceae bacterium]
MLPVINKAVKKLSERIIWNIYGAPVRDILWEYLHDKPLNEEKKKRLRKWCVKDPANFSLYCQITNHRNKVNHILALQSEEVVSKYDEVRAIVKDMPQVPGDTLEMKAVFIRLIAENAGKVDIVKQLQRILKIECKHYDYQFAVETIIHILLLAIVASLVVAFCI